MGSEMIRVHVRRDRGNDLPVDPDKALAAQIQHEQRLSAAEVGQDRRRPEEARVIMRGKPMVAKPDRLRA